jgi:hypothetical protein
MSNKTFEIHEDNGRFKAILKEDGTVIGETVFFGSHAEAELAGRNALGLNDPAPEEAAPEAAPATEAPAEAAAPTETPVEAPTEAVAPQEAAPAVEGPGPEAIGGQEA